MYQLVVTKHFEKKSSSVCKNNGILKQKLAKTLSVLKTDPFSQSLRSHKVNSRVYGVKYSSRVNGDIRIIWDFSKDRSIQIYLLDMGGHSGKKSVY